ncbi:hypothetical protein Poli38472_003753 [Pythium oligandrum]|uniref:Uncharacterized protein n=1 Tax=Pythium oligandrum TaxID=41045 RepID=A0A8K1CN74_PYTOL|nr:hypothetical protein Poli38472_003753 [Pythium oligandrum]|eukprot:TMW65988.1 hypothetical protein Poli38472_003753 [Pythium oligandrum]
MAKEQDTVPSKWDASHIPSLQDKVAVVTGSNIGLGYETALQLARKGANVILACRNETRGSEAAKKIQEELSDMSDAGKVEFRQLDVSDLSSVKRFAEELHKSHDRLDILVNNAGVMAVPYAETVDGFESQMGTNHLGHFALTAQVFDLLKQSPAARVVNVSSMGHRSAFRWDEDKIMMDSSNYDAWSAYANSKLANLLFTFELKRRLEANGVDNVKSVVCHPGLTSTNIYSAPTQQHGWFQSMVWRVSSAMPVSQSVQQGALPALYAATAPGAKNGEYYGPGGMLGIHGHPDISNPSKKSQSLSSAAKLWELSERLTKTQFPFQK